MACSRNLSEFRRDPIFFSCVRSFIRSSLPRASCSGGDVGCNRNSNSLTSRRLPNPRSGEFDHMAVRIAEVKAPRAAFPCYLAQDLDMMLPKSRSPRVQRGRRNTKRDMSRPSAVVLRQSAWRESDTVGCLIRRSRSFVSNEKEISLIGHAEHAAAVACLDLHQTQDLLVEGTGPRKILHEQRRFH